jgi:hypothetical protein
MDRPYVKVTVTEKGERALRNRHPWVYGEEVTGADGAYENGGIVDVYSQKGRWLGAGFVNDASKIRVRIISRNANDRFDGAFWERRLRYAVDYRRAVMGDDFSCCRLVFGEADGLPGLTVDRFEDVLVAQCMCLGMEKLKDGLYLKLVDIMYELGIKISAVYERNDAALREKEGMEQGKGFALGSGDGHVLITENGIKYDVDYVNGQKTGFFLDQKYNRLAVAKLAKGRRVLDCFTHTGAFGLNCAAAGAAEGDVSGHLRRGAGVREAERRPERAGRGIRPRGHFRPAHPHGGGEAAGLRPHHSRPAGLHQKRRDPEGRGAGLQGNQHESHEAAAPWRLSGHLLLLPFYDGRAFPRHAALRRHGRRRESPADRGPAAGTRSPRGLGRA